MLQKCAILGLALLCVGGLATAWVYNETQTEQAQAPAPGVKSSLGPEEYLDKYGRWYQLSPEQQNQLVLELDKDRQDKTPEQLVRERQARLRADLGKLAAGQMNPGDIANELYGAGWEAQVEQYKKLKEQMEIAQISSIMCLSIGSILVASCVLIWGVRSAARVVRKRSGRRVAPPLPKAELTDIEPDEDETPASTAEELPKHGRRRLTRQEPAVDPFPIDIGPPRESDHNESLSPLMAARTRQYHSLSAGEPAAGDCGLAVLLTDEPSQEARWSADSQWSVGQAAVSSAAVVSREPQTTVRTRIPAAAPAKPEPSVVETALKEQAETLQKQIAEFKEEVSQSVQQATRDHSEPLSNTLKELAQQVSAIREYAASQQDRVEKLQDGYDWGIIRTFCLRVIRCVDNIEHRIDNPPQDCADLMYLEEVRDELLFAMESSGVEQFSPELNSEYRGQEKLAEAIREKQPAQKPEQAGRIAQVLRPGYRYMIDDENYKVVRTAQVKLFG
ncbi:MAG: nucleotide exchange factor GrpE [Planctomycetes bacterium]|nr:nucleotide exchange factor GrpE [Planctomycetota bacterium]